MRRKLLATTVSGILLLTATALVILVSGHAAALLVDSKAVIFLAGESSGSGGGTPPPSIDLAPDTDFIKFTSVSGFVNCCSGVPNTPPDGIAGFSGTNISSFSGISGIIKTNPNGIMFLTGVFTDGGDPEGTAPPILNFNDSAIGAAFTELSPLLNQSFFIGDGKTGDGSGALQEFNAPDGATKLFLGFADANGFSGDPGSYGDNTGFFDVFFELTLDETPAPPPGVPEPTTLALLGAALLGLTAATRRQAAVAARR